MKTIEVSVVIPNYNGEELLKKNLPSVLDAFRNKENNIIEILVVDDASKDRSVALLKKSFPEVKVIKHKKNRGFSSSVNMGARMSRGNLIVLLNTDVIPSKDFLVNALPHFKNEKVFAVSLHEKGYGWARGFFSDGFINHEQGKESKDVHETFWVNGGSGIFRRSMWMELGGMDEKLLNPFYWEDIDLSYRAAKRGWLLFWEPRAKVVHEHESTMKKIPQGYKRRIQERNQLIVIWKNLTSSQLFRKHIAGLFKRIGKHPGYLRIVFTALLNIKSIIKARNKELKEGRISDEAIFAKFKES
jgi:GT2 family glycosyltransferase